MREKEFLPQVRDKLGIAELNEMQKRMMASASEGRDIILLSPTGSGKTLAFILPMLKQLKPVNGNVQVVILAPSRELALQIVDVLRGIGAGIKTTALYGGHKFEDEQNSLQAGADVIVATPGRLLDHINRMKEQSSSHPRVTETVRILILDEFDKMLELGFEREMKKIVGKLKNVSRTILTSATRADVLPDFLQLENPLTIDYLEQNKNLRRRMRVHRVDSDKNDKLESLRNLLYNLSAKTGGYERAIVFVNHRESAERIAQYLIGQKVPAVLYHGALDQRERESAVAQFNNGTRPILVATDLAARGLDIKDVMNVIHYHQALTPEAYTHRNGRTARVDGSGDIYVLLGPEESVKEFTEFDDTFWLDSEVRPESASQGETLYFSAGRKEKLSKGDILGFLVKEIGLQPADIGAINVFDHYSLAAISVGNPKEVLEKARRAKIKGERRQVTLLGK